MRIGTTTMKNNYSVLNYFIFAALSIMLSCAAPIGSEKKESSDGTLSNQEILEKIEQHRPSLGATIPADIKHILGATHVDGKYHLTDEPFLIEGCRVMEDFGFGVAKLWFTKSMKGYHFNSDWNLTPHSFTLKQLAEHPYYKTCFDMSFSTIVLMLEGGALETTDLSAKEEEEEIYELTKYLLETYKNRKVTFILQNWEGDWLFRNGVDLAAQWSKTPDHVNSSPIPADIGERQEAMVKWFSARQRGVDRARNEVSGGNCEVFHAIEVNKVMDAMEGIPGIVNNVLPFVKTDMVSWSTYDAILYDGRIDDGVNLYKGVDFLREKMVPSEVMNGQKVVFFGELGIPDQGVPMEDEVIENNLDAYMGVALAQQIPYLIYWELYCNEPKEEAPKNSGVREADEMRGFWIIHPDGSKSIAGKYYASLLANSGKKL